MFVYELSGCGFEFSCSHLEIDKFRISFYNMKNHKNLYTSEIRETEKNLVELEESLQFKKFYDDDYNDEYKKI